MKARERQEETAHENATAEWLADLVRNGILAGTFRPDRIVLCHDGSHYLLEIKEQERYLAPPYDGHGLPQWQLSRYLHCVEHEPRVRTLFQVDEPETGLRFIQWFDVLNAGEKFTTRGQKPRVIFPLANFLQIDPRAAPPRTAFQIL